MISVIPVRLALIVRRSVLVLLLASCGHAGDKTVPLGMNVVVCDKVSAYWTAAQAAEVCNRAFEPFLAAWQEHYPHWDVVDARRQKVRAVLNLTVLAEGEDELLTGVMLCIFRTSDPTSCERFLLAHNTWYEPGDMMLWGSPDPDETVTQLGTFLKKLFPDYSGGSKDVEFSEDLLLDKLPLATTPKWVGEQDKRFILPLPKTRYNHLGLSTFRIRSTTSNRDEVSLGVKARDEWDVYDPNLTEALVVRPPDPNAIPWSTGYQRATVFLDSYEPPDEAAGWEEFWPG
jgi:hypothetical protein